MFVVSSLRGYYRLWKGNASAVVNVMKVNNVFTSKQSDGNGIITIQIPAYIVN
jgi:hypothetical protein